MTSTHHPVSKLILNFLNRPSTSHKAFCKRLAALPTPWFDNEDEAYNELVKLADEVAQHQLWSFDFTVRFFAYNIPNLFLSYAPTYKVFWELRKGTYLGEAVTALPPYTTEHNTVNDCLEFLNTLSNR